MVLKSSSRSLGSLAEQFADLEISSDFFVGNRSKHPKVCLSQMISWETTDGHEFNTV